MRKSLLAGIALVTIAFVAVPSIAIASHFRSSHSTVTVNNAGVMSWTIDSAWRKGADDQFGLAQLFTVPNAATAPGGGTLVNGFNLSGTATPDLTNPLYDLNNEVFTADLSSIANGTYDLYSENCCRVSGVQNTNSNNSFSQWIRFTKTGSTYNLPPQANNPSLYLIVDTTNETDADFTATDPEGTAVTYTPIYATGGPSWGGTQLPCSTFVNGLLKLASAYCTGSDVFTAIYLPGTYWTAKVQATDADGNFSVVDTLFRVITTPDPIINSHTVTGNGTSADFTVAALDSIANNFTVTCTSTSSASDIVTGTGTASPISLTGFTPGSSYSCDIDAVNNAGPGTRNQNYAVGPIVISGLELRLTVNTGDTLSGLLAHLFGGNLAPNSAYSLTRYADELVVYQGTTDGSGNFSHDVSLPQGVCTPGVHRLVLAGTSASSQPLTDTAWFELTSSCTVMQFARTEITATPTLASTGIDVVPYLMVGTSTILAGLALLLYRRRMVGD